MPRRPAPAGFAEAEAEAEADEGCHGGQDEGTMEAYQGCLLTGGSSVAAPPSGGGASSSLEDAAAAAGWSMEDMGCLAASIEEEVAAAGWSMDDVTAMLDCSLSPEKAQQPPPALRPQPARQPPRQARQPQRAAPKAAIAAMAAMAAMGPVSPAAPIAPREHGAATAKPAAPAPGAAPPAAPAAAPSAAPPAALPMHSDFEVQVQLLSGDTIPLHCDPSDSLRSVQQRLEALTGIPVAEQRLVPAAPGAVALPTGGVAASLLSLGVDGDSSPLRLSVALDDVVVSVGGNPEHAVDMDAWRFSNAEGDGCTAKQRAQFRKVVVTVTESLIEVAFPYDPKFVKLIKRVGGGGKARWQGQAKGGAWTIAPAYLSHLLELFPGATVLRPAADKDAAGSAAAVSTERLMEEAALDETLPNGWTLYDHQKEAVVAILQERRQILAYDMGLGKTVISLVAAKAWQRVTNGAVLVICPVSVRSSWEAEAEMVDVVISTHSWGSVPAPPPRTGTAGYFLVADEAHYMQSLESKRTIAALKLCASAGALVLATGTP